VRPEHISVLGGSLSGGNLQRLILAREFDRPTSLMVAVNPAAGLDLAMSLRIRRELRQYVAEGRSVLLISPDLDELLKTCDRISVMFAGRIIGTEHVSNLNSQSLGLLLGGNGLATTPEILPSLTNYNSDWPIEVGQDMPV
jgi:general nucleoside transport system ATP-binding protein